MRRFILLLASCCLLFFPLMHADTQALVVVKDLGVVYSYGVRILFSATFETKASIKSAEIHFQVEGETDIHTGLLKMDGSGNGTYVHFIQKGLIRPFAHVEYWYQLDLSDGTTFDSSHYSFRYIDNRYPWQTLQSGSLSVNWITGDSAFGQAALAAAEAGYGLAQHLVPVNSSDPIEIYIYATPEDVQTTLNLGGYMWTDGNADPQIGLVMVPIAPGEAQAAEMGQRIPHEMIHLLLYRWIGPAYEALPGWLVEGIASQAEYPPKFGSVQAIRQAEANQGLLSIAALCGPFPAAAAAETLAEAESASFSRYLITTYGIAKFQRLIQAYADGLNCSRGVKAVFNLPFSQLEGDWRRATFGEEKKGSAFQEFLPYIVLLGLMLVAPAWHLLGLGKRGKHGRKSSR